MGFKDIFDDFLNRSSDRNRSPGDGTEGTPALDRFEEQEQEIFGGIEHWRKYQEGFYRFLKHPIKVMIAEPITAFFVSVPVALLLLIGGGLLLLSLVLLISCKQSLQSCLLLLRKGAAVCGLLILSGLECGNLLGQLGQRGHDLLEFIHVCSRFAVID